MPYIQSGFRPYRKPPVNNTEFNTELIVLTRTESRFRGVRYLGGLGPCPRFSCVAPGATNRTAAAAELAAIRGQINPAANK